METLEHLKLDDLVLDPNQPRKDFNPEMLEELANSIAAVGVIQPIRVRRNPSAALGQSDYMIIAGERRWLASKKAGKDTAILKYEPEIRALVRDGKLRDYSLLKKISALRSDKRQRAIALINSGDSNAKEFFARRRYDKKTNGVNQDAESSDRLL